MQIFMPQAFCHADSSRSRSTFTTGRLLSRGLAVRLASPMAVSQYPLGHGSFLDDRCLSSVRSDSSGLPALRAFCLALCQTVNENSSKNWPVRSPAAGMSRNFHGVSDNEPSFRTRLLI